MAHSTISGAAARQALRDALRAHPGIDAAIRENTAKGLIRPDKARINDMAMGELLTLCAVLGLNPQEIVSASLAAPRPIEAPAPVPAVPATPVASSVPQDSEDEAPMFDEAARLSADALAPLDAYRGMLHPSMIAELEERVSSLATLAAKPAQVVHVPVPAPQGATGAVVPFPVAPVARPVHKPRVTRQEVAGRAFGIGARGRFATLNVGIWDAPDAPPVDAGYVWDTALLADMVTTIEHGESLWLFGPKGTGKTTAFEQYAARTGRPFVRIGCRPDMESVELVGMNAIQGGTTVFKPGTLTRAVQRPGTLILIDEPTLATRIHALLQTALDFRFLTVHEDEGEVVRLADGVVIVAADNTNGVEDATGNYTGTGRSNAAFLNRFSKFVPVGFLPPAKEAEAIVSRTGVPMPAANMLAQWASRTRQGANNGDLSEGVSLRNLVYFARDLKRGADPQRAFQTTILNGANPGDAVALEAARKTDLDFAMLGQAMTGNTPVAPPQSMDDEEDATKRARNVFDTLS